MISPYLEGDLLSSIASLSTTLSLKSVDLELLTHILDTVVPILIQTLPPLTLLQLLLATILNHPL